MRRLILLRHGKAESTAGDGDFERALTERGRLDAALTGRALAEAGFAPDLVLVSTAKRAIETWEAVQSLFPKARVAASRALYHAQPEALAEAIDSAGGAAEAVMIVGHNPGLHELAMALPAEAGTRADRILRDSFPTAAAAVFEAQADGTFRLERFLTPSGLGGGAS